MVQFIQTIPTIAYRGDDQDQRDAFFSMLEIPVDYELLNPTNNTISITFSDTGGMLTTASLQTFKFSKPIDRTGRYLEHWRCATTLLIYYLSKSSVFYGVYRRNF